MDDLIKAFSSEFIEAWLLAHDHSALAVHAEAIAGALGPILAAFAAAVAWLGQRAWRNVELWRAAADLHPYFSTQEVRRATRYFVPCQFQSVSPGAEEEPGKTATATARQPLIPWMLSEALAHGRDERRYYVILGGAGMGKTTLMINLYLAYAHRWS